MERRAIPAATAGKAGSQRQTVFLKSRHSCASSDGGTTRSDKFKIPRNESRFRGPSPEGHEGIDHAWPLSGVDRGFVKQPAEKLMKRPDIFRVVLVPAFPGHKNHFHQTNFGRSGETFPVDECHNRSMSDGFNKQSIMAPPRWKALIVATLRSFVLFIILDIATEFLMSSVFSVRIKEMLPRTDSGASFLITYYGLIFIALLMIFMVFAVCRPLFRSPLKAVFSVGLAMYLFTTLILLQLVNLGFLPLSMFTLMGITNTIELPLVLWMGADTYTRYTRH
jgi:hypothetical protein